MGNINAVTDLQIDNGVGVITIDSPPVNALSKPVRDGLQAAFHSVLDDPEANAVVLICAGRTFFAGADISEFGRTDAASDFAEVTMRMENAPKPIIAAIHGTALGGGLEVALTCHYRVAVPSAKVGLPEVNLGILPGAGGTQRLPRIVGVEAALDLITSGRPVGAVEAHKLGIVDELVEEGKLREQAIAFAQRIVREKRPLKKVRDMNEKLEAARGKPELFIDYRKKHARAFRGFKAPEAIIRSIEAAVNLPFEEGLQWEQALFQELVVSRESQAQRHAFFAEREVAKIPDVPSQTPVRSIKTIGVVGAGTMGGGIAMNFLNVGLPVTLIDASQEALDRGMTVMRKNYEATAKRGRMSAADVETRMTLLRPALSLDQLANCDLVIEAVFENLDVKTDVFRRLDTSVKPQAILATNTSFLDVDAIAAATSRPERVVGLHFFSPANVMRLLEVVRGRKTSPDVVATAMQLGRKLGKIAVLSRVCHGFIANRAMQARMDVANELILEGPLPWDIDRVMTDFGFPMGPFAMFDLVGLDVLSRDARTPAGSTVQQALFDMGRWGQKKNGGFYDYDSDRKPTPSPVAERLIGEFAAKQCVKPRQFSDAQLLELLLYPVVNEGAKILEEGIALRPGDIDIALIHGYGWPVYTGGPMFWADTVGLKHIVERLQGLQAERGEFFKPCALLEQLARQGKKFLDA